MLANILLISLPNQLLPGFAVALQADGTLWTCTLNLSVPVPLRIGTDIDW